MAGGYWSEGICYQFDAGQIDQLEAATAELHAMCLEAVDLVIAKDLFSRIGLGAQAAALARESWRKNEISLYGRFDLSYDGKSEPKLLEYNADTPTALYEASIAQWVWLEELLPHHDQFNSIHEKLSDAFRAFQLQTPGTAPLFFTCVKEHEEDLVTVEYMRDVASQAGLATRHIYIEDIGYNPVTGEFIDTHDQAIRHLFKLYPWEWLLADEFGKHITLGQLTLLEPAWKMVLATKGILPVLWDMFPGHKNLLPSALDPSCLGSRYVKKPFFSREGANIEVSRDGLVLATGGSYGSQGCVYQALQALPRYANRYPVVGSWIVNGAPAGIGIREDDSPITKNTSCFVPHYFID